MEYNDFVEQVKEKIQDFLPEKFADASVTVNQVVKNNDCVLDGLTIRTEESNISPTVYLNPYFEQIQDGAEMDDVLGQIAATYQAHYIDHDIATPEEQAILSQYVGWGGLSDAFDASKRVYRRELTE